jgi:hypothetical protein
MRPQVLAKRQGRIDLAPVQVIRQPQLLSQRRAAAYLSGLLPFEFMD